MNFDLSADQKLLVQNAGQFARKSSPVARLRRLRDDPLGYEPAVWKQMGELGWLGVLFPESMGGFGGSFLDAALVLEQLGTTLVPEPYLPAVVLAGMAVLRAGSAEQQARWLEPLIAGQHTLALAYAERQSRHDVHEVATRAERSASGWRLVGEKVFVLEGHAAAGLIVSARTAGGRREAAGLTLFAVDRQSPGLTVRPIMTMDGHRAAVIGLDDVEVGGEGVLGPVDGAGALLAELMDLGAAAACAEGLGIMQAVLAMTTTYLKTREQFGAPIGSFQALQHRAVDMFVETELMRSLTIEAALKVDGGDSVERATAVSAAKVQLAVGGRYVTQQGIQLHGGIGITDEHDIGLYFKRMHVLNALFGDEEHHVARFGSLPSFTAELEAAP